MWLREILESWILSQNYATSQDPKGTKGLLFYNPREHIVLVSTNLGCLEDNYIINPKPNGRFYFQGVV